MNVAQPVLQAPDGTCDCHMHILYPPAEMPVAPGKTPWPDATVTQYREVAARLGISRCIMTQTPCYGIDNSWVLKAMKEFGEGALGTAAVDASINQQELDSLTAAGIRGAALHLTSGGPFDWKDVPAIAARVMEVDWHLDIQLNGVELANHVQMLLRLPNTLVIDHVGKFHNPVDVNHEGFKALLQLIDTGRCYVKLSAPYESAWEEPPYLNHSGALATALIKAAPERMLWGSNWPHVGVPDPIAKPDDAMLLDTLLHWSVNSTERDVILSANPSQLYGYAA
jgi:D-galactarolactone isomerase